MYQAFENMLLSLAPFDKTELQDALPRFQLQRLQKNEYFCKEGKITDNLAFVNKGLLRSYFSIKGRETTTFFLSPGAIAVALNSFVNRQEALENIQAITDVDLLVIKRRDLYDLYEEDWKWQQVGRKLIEQAYILMEKRSISLQSKNAHERYREFTQDYPEVILYTPLNQIASFLGISPETLSRIRKDS